MKSYQKLVCLAGVSFLLTMLISCGAKGNKPKEDIAEEIYRTYESPNGQFKIVVYRSPQTTAMPGQSGDAPGKVCLFDRKTGKLLERKQIEMVQAIGFHDVRWSETNVFITSFFEWKLP